MDSAGLLAIARQWSYWDEGPAASIRRRLALPTESVPGIALVVQGCGDAASRRSSGSSSTGIGSTRGAGLDVVAPDGRSFREVAREMVSIAAATLGGESCDWAVPGDLDAVRRRIG